MPRKREELRAAALEIFEAGLAAVDPYQAVKRCLQRDGNTLTLQVPGGPQHQFDRSSYERIVVVGGGKATARMSQAVEELLAGQVSEGVIVVKYDHLAETERVKVVEAAHPVPDQAGQRGAREVLELLDTLGPKDLVFSLISGGGSALLPAPAEGISLEEKQQLTALLLSAGADIGEMNAVRKHISALKGGQLARRAHPATVVNLMLSDVVGDRLDVIASGPAVPDPSTFADAKEILERYSIWEKTPDAIRERFTAGVAGEIPDTPKEGDPAFDRCVNAIIGSNIIALEACAAAAQAKGWNTLLLASTMEGETKDVARVHATIAQQVRSTGDPLKSPACLISGGETTVTLDRSGKGGRNQEFALAAVRDITGMEGTAVVSAGTDGTDGPTDAAGAIAYGDTAERAAAAGLDPERSLLQHDAYPFFDALGDLIKTGPTGTNVMDVHLVLVD